MWGATVTGSSGDRYAFIDLESERVRDNRNIMSRWCAIPCRSILIRIYIFRHYRFALLELISAEQEMETEP